MSSYSQILSSTAQGTRNLWFIAGPDKALVQDAYEHAKQHAYADAEAVTLTTFVGGTCSPTEVARRLQQHGHERSVVVMLDAEKFTGWGEVENLLRRIPKTDYFIAVSNEDKPDEAQQHVALFRGNTKARYVLCKPFEQDEAVEWINSKLSMQAGTAQHLIERSKGDSEWLLNVVRKLQSLNTHLSLRFVEKVVTGSGTPDLRDSLLHYRKRDALRALKDTAPEPSTVSGIVEDVRKASQIREAMRTVGHYSKPRLRERTKLNDKTIMAYRPLSQLYDRANSFRSMRAISSLHSRLVRQDRSAWLSLVAKW